MLQPIEVALVGSDDRCFEGGAAAAFCLARLLDAVGSELGLAPGNAAGSAERLEQVREEVECHARVVAQWRILGGGGAPVRGSHAATFPSVSRTKARVSSKRKSLVSVFLILFSPNLSAFFRDFALYAWKVRTFLFNRPRPVLGPDPPRLFLGSSTLNTAMKKGTSPKRPSRRRRTGRAGEIPLVRATNQGNSSQRVSCIKCSNMVPSGLGMHHCSKRQAFARWLLRGGVGPIHAGASTRRRRQDGQRILADTSAMTYWFHTQGMVAAAEEHCPDRQGGVRAQVKAWCERRKNRTKSIRAVVSLPPEGGQRQATEVSIQVTGVEQGERKGDKVVHYGLFAAEDMARGRLVAYYWARENRGSTSAYRMSFNGMELDGAKGGVASLINHSCGDSANCEFVEEADAVTIRTRRAVTKGEELLASYLPGKDLELPREERHDKLCFVCHCDRCDIEAP